MPEPDLAKLRIPTQLRDRTREIFSITDQACVTRLDDEYGQLCRLLVARLARKRP